MVAAAGRSNGAVHAVGEEKEVAVVRQDSKARGEKRKRPPRQRESRDAGAAGRPQAMGAAGHVLCPL